MIHLFTLCVALLACTGTTSPSSESTVDAPPKPESAEAPPVASGPASTVKTTTCSLWMTNTQANLEQAQRRYEATPNTLTRMALATAHFTLGKATASLDHIHRAGELAALELESKPEHEPALALLVDVHFTMHRVDEARAALAALEKKSPERGDLVTWTSELQWMAGEVEPVRDFVVKSATERPDFWTLTRRANLYRSFGEFDKAEADFAAAEAAWTGTAPIPLAWLNVQRGLMDLHRGNYERAALFFREGYERCPEYPMASEHLAEIEGRLGNTERSIELYRAVVDQTGDPEFLVALAETLGEGDESQQLIERARAENIARLEKYPEAMYWHAAEFFLDAGNDPAKGLELLQKNMELRPNHDSRVALAGALLDNGKAEEAWKTLEPTLEDPLVDAEMYWTAARITGALGKSDESSAFADQARALNPKIEDLEGPL